MKKLILHLAVANSMVMTSSTVSAETKKVNLSAGLNYVLSQVVTKGDNNQSHHNMGMLYYLGKKGVPVDHKKAAEWFSKAAVNGFAPSQYALAVMYLNGDGVPQDTEKGVTLLQSAAWQGQPEAVKLYNTLQAKAQQLNAELTEHLGYEKNSPRIGKNTRNGYTTKRLFTDDGEFELDTPRDRDGTFEPQLIKKMRSSASQGASHKWIAKSYPYTPKA